MMQSPYFYTRVKIVFGIMDMLYLEKT